MLLHILRTGQEITGWPESMPATSFSGGRGSASASAGLQWSSQLTEGLVELLGVPGARLRARFDQADAAAATAMRRRRRALARGCARVRGQGG